MKPKTATELMKSDLINDAIKLN